VPAGVRRALFSRGRLCGKTRNVLAALYHLDALGGLDAPRDNLPPATGLSWEACLEALGELEKKGLVRNTSSGVVLLVKPLRYES
jgi:hypothetical protein